jgi:hypothetical protein
MLVSRTPKDRHGLAAGDNSGAHDAGNRAERGRRRRCGGSGHAERHGAKAVANILIDHPNGIRKAKLAVSGRDGRR